MTTLQSAEKQYDVAEKRLVAELARVNSGEEEKRQEKIIRIEELTAYLDALTGGQFSKNK